MQLARFFGAATLAAAASLFVVVTPACSSGPSNEEACSKYESLCNASSGGDSGVSASVTVTCKPDAFDQISNADEVKECIEGAADCTAATACYGKAQR